MLGHLLRGEARLPDFHVRSLAPDELYGSYPDVLPESFARSLEIDGANSVYLAPWNVTGGFDLAVCDVCEPIRNDVAIDDAHVVLLAADPLRFELVNPWLEEGNFSLAVIDRRTATRLLKGSSARSTTSEAIEEPLARCCTSPK
jgi:hypothetical protein